MIAVVVPGHSWPVHVVQLDNGPTMADWLVAGGTIGAAIGAAVGLLVSLRINQRDRSAAEEEARRNREFYTRQSLAERQHTRALAERGRIVSLLLELGKLVARNRGTSDSTTRTETDQQIRLLLLALPRDTAVLSRTYWGVDLEEPNGGPATTKLAQLDPEQQLRNLGDTVSLLREIADDINDYTRGDALLEGIARTTGV